MDNLIVENATERDLLYVDSLQRKNAEELAFYPRQVFEREIQNSRIILARVNGEPAGYIYYGALGHTCKIHQACIQYDLRGQLYGAEIVRYLLKLADLYNVLAVTLRCGSDIAANDFWMAMGFYCEAVTQGGVRRMRDINCWRYDLQQPLFKVEDAPSRKKKNSSLWARRGNVSSSSFARGKQIKAYRKLIVGHEQKTSEG